jgi:hypothetical protein
MEAHYHRAKHGTVNSPSARLNGNTRVALALIASSVSPLVVSTLGCLLYPLKAGAESLTHLLPGSSPSGQLDDTRSGWAGHSPYLTCAYSRNRRAASPWCGPFFVC